MARKTIIVCDICESDNGVTTWEIKSTDTGEKKKAELCTKHAELLAVLVRGEVTSGAAPRRRRGGVQPMTLEEIEAQKAAGGV